MRELVLGALALLSLGLGLTSARAQQIANPAISGIACAYNSSLPTVSTGTWGLVQCDANGRIILSGTVTGGGTASNFGSAFPSAGTAVGARDTSGNMQSFSLDAAGVGANLDVNCKVGCSGSDVPIAPIHSSVIEASHIFKASAGNLFDAYCTATTTAGFCMLFDSTTAPSDGSVTPYAVINVAANSTTSFNLATGHSMPFTTGIVGVFSSTGPFTKTGSATAFLSARVQ